MPRTAPAARTLRAAFCTTGFRKSTLAMAVLLVRGFVRRDLRGHAELDHVLLEERTTLRDLEIHAGEHRRALEAGHEVGYDEVREGDALDAERRCPVLGRGGQPEVVGNTARELVHETHAGGPALLEL